ncbi:MAG: hypothetical protein LC746_09390 [Acidobacteria bacterium]|nr:hypothetical protein [Acidobacteriota bacterium]
MQDAEQPNQGAGCIVALIGLQFVVLTLIAGRPVVRAEAQAGAAFSTPSVVHFGVVL